MLEAEDNAETMDSCCLLAFLSWMAQSAFLYNLQLYLSDEITHYGLCSSPTITNWENVLELNLIETFSQGGTFISDDSSLCEVGTQKQSVK